MTFNREVSKSELENRRKRSINSRIVMIGYSGVLHRKEELARDLGVDVADFLHLLGKVCADHYQRTNAQHWFNRGRECSLRAFELQGYNKDD